MYENKSKMCRTCLGIGFDDMLSIFTKNKEDEYIPDIIKGSMGIDIEDDDKYPAKICAECLKTINFVNANRKKFKENYNTLRKMIEKLEDIKPKTELPLAEEDVNYSKEIIKIEASEEITFIEVVEEEAESDPHCYDHNEDDEEEDDLEDDTPLLVIAKKLKKERKKTTQKRRKGKVQKQETEEEKDNLPSRNNNKCYTCDQLFESYILLTEHLSSHMDKLPYNCDTCVLEKVVIKTLAGLNLHLKMHQQPIKCNFCDRRYSSKRARAGHEETFHLKKNAGSQICEICSKECKSMVNYKRHVKTHTLEYQCDVCKKCFGSTSILNRHVVKHTGERPYECTVCGQKFTHITNYQVHIKRHTGEKAHECVLCPSKFIVPADLKNHMRVHHSDNEYKPKRNLREFYTVKTNEGTKKKEYHCNICKKIFPKTGDITHHMLTHFKTHQCLFCGQCFKNGRSLSDHENTHTGAKPHKCKYCGKCFANNSNLYQHHKIHTGVKNYKCEMCDKTFTYKENMKTHIRIHHTKEKPFECVLCDKKFIDNSSYKKHRQMHSDLPVDNFGQDWYNEYG